MMVERLWPRGLANEKAALDPWLKDVAPSAELRRWFGHDPAKWPDFQRRYREELRRRPREVAQLKELSAEGTVTFVYGSRDPRHNAALVLRDACEGRTGEQQAA